MKLNLGCGFDIKEGWINLDKNPGDNVNVVHDLNELPLPFENDAFNYILCNDILEHVSYLPLMNELHRILKKRGILRIRVPHFTSQSNYKDPTHINTFSSKTFNYFIKTENFGYKRGINLFSRGKFYIILEKSRFRILRFMIKFLEKRINQSKRHQAFYERSFLKMFSAIAIVGFIIK